MEFIQYYSNCQKFKWDFDKINNNKLISIHSDEFDEISILVNAKFNPKANILKK